jgi:uncharacterized membrane protein
MHLFWIVAVIFVLMICGGAALIVLLVMRTQSTSTSPVPVTFPAMRETPLQILDRRFAAGEVSADDYKKARDLLTGGGPKP